MILSWIISTDCENCQLCYQLVKIENYLQPAHKDYYALRKQEPLP